MALTSWKGSIVRKQVIFIAKNYLSNDEIDTLNRLVVIFLETAELLAKDRLDITMSFWKENVDRILEFNDKKVLTGRDSVSSAEMEQNVREIYDAFDARRKAYEAEMADKQDIEEFEDIIKKAKPVICLVQNDFLHQTLFYSVLPVAGTATFSSEAFSGPF